MYSGGEGTAENPYLIATEQDLSDVRHNVRMHFKQIADIYCEWDEFEPLGNREPFKGVYNGNNKRIFNINIVGEYNASLFGIVGDDWFEGDPGDNAHIYNLDIINARCEVTDYRGQASIMAYIVNGLIEDCSVNGTVIGFFAEGFAYGVEDSGLIRRCSSDTTVIGNYGSGFIYEVRPLSYSGTNYKIGVVDCIAHGTVKPLQSDDGYYYISGFSNKHYGCERCITTMTIENELHARINTYLSFDGIFAMIGNSNANEYPMYLRDCYADVQAGGHTENWNSQYGYSYHSSHVRGDDGVLYTPIARGGQSYFVPSTGEIGFYDAHPVTGSIGSQYWQPATTADAPIAQNTSFFSDPNNLTNYDFENVWELIPGAVYPSLKRNKGSFGRLHATKLNTVFPTIRGE